MTKNPWTVNGSVSIYDNAWISLTEYAVINPSGNRGIYGVVHFKNVAIGILALDSNKYLTLVGQHRFPLDRYSWEIPEGGGPLHTDPLDSAKRELLEETGLEAATWELLTEIHLSNSVSDERGMIFLATQLTQRDACPEDTEELVVKKVHIDDAYQMVLNGEITDSMSVAGILRLKLLTHQSGNA